ncbi:MAG TPA: stimulus-sensing domain-containing protein, partial [Reyranella sp.]|nr:stimulus-sensing domain-containing protein [Reyranella sp.]
MADTIRDRGRVEPTLDGKPRASHTDWRLPESESKSGAIVSFFRRKPKPAAADDGARREPQMRRPEAPTVPKAERPQPPAKPKPAPARRAEPAPEKPRGKSLPARRSLWMSPITRRILLLNVMALAIPVFGLLYLPTYRDSLIQSELELLKTEGELFSGALASSGVITDPDGSERLQPDTSRQTIRRLVDVSKTRARLFLPNGTLIADSFLLSGPGG